MIFFIVKKYCLNNSKDFVNCDCYLTNKEVLLAMFAIVQILFFILMWGYVRNRNTCLVFLFGLFFISFVLQFLVGSEIKQDSIITVLNVCFINISIFQIFSAWGDAKISYVHNGKNGWAFFMKPYLRMVLSFNIILNILLIIIVYTFMPNIAELKAAQGYRELYDSIPFFSTAFRYSYFTQNLGFIAFPYVFYHLSRNEKKKSIEYLLYSLSSLLCGFAFYSRAMMVTWVLVLILYYFLVKGAIADTLNRKIYKYARISILILSSLFVIITVIRFTAMDYYADRIPKSSLIKDPVLYSLVDYASCGYPNGLNLMDTYEEQKNLKGEEILQLSYQALAFFGYIKWDADSSLEKKERSYGDSLVVMFKGYTCNMVYNFGYILTFLIGCLYYFYVRRVLSYKKVSIENCMILVLLLIIPATAIFYCSYGAIITPAIFLMIFVFVHKILYISLKNT